MSAAALQRSIEAEAVAAALAMPAQCAQFAAGAEVLSTACRSWRTIPPSTPADLEAVATQLLGLSRSLAEIRQRLAPHTPGMTA